MKWESLENKMKDKLSAHHPPVDVDAIWAAIEPEVDAINRRKKRRGFIWIWWLGAIVAGSFIGYYYMSNDSAIMAEKNPVPPIIGTEVKHIPQDQATAQAVVEEANEKAAEPENISTKNSFSSKNHPAKINPASRLAAGKLNDSSLNQNSNMVGKTSEIDAKISLSNTSLNENQRQEPAVESVEKLSVLSPLQTLQLPRFQSNTSLPELNLLEAKPVENAPPAKRPHYNFSTNLQGSISFVDRELGLTDSAALELKKLRNQTERVLESYQIGLGFSYHHRSGLTLSTGANYTQINELFESNNTVVKVDTVYGIKYLSIGLDDDTTAIYGDIPITTKTTFQKKYYNKLRMVDIPILAGYEFHFRKATVGLQAGVFVNLKLQAKGQILNSASETIQLEEANIFKPQIGLSYYFAASAGYKLSDNMEAYISPFMRYFPKSFTKDYPLSQRYNLYGANIGIRYRF